MIQVNSRHLVVSLRVYSFFLEHQKTRKVTIMLRPSIQKAIERIFKAAATAAGGLAIGLGLLGGAQPAAVQAADQNRPNILVIMGDDVGWFNIGAYHRGIMSGKTPHLDKLAAEGMLFTDYYAEASCTAGRANFITGEFPFAPA